MRGEAAAELEAANRALAAASAEFFEVRSTLVHGQFVLVVATTLRPMIEVMAGDRRALRELTGLDVTMAAELREMARDGAHIEPPEQRAVREAAVTTTAALRRAAGVPENWAWRLPEAERQPAAPLAMPGQRGGRGVRI